MIEQSGRGEFSGSNAGGNLPGNHDQVYDLIDIVYESPDKIYELTDVVEEPGSLLKEGSPEVLIVDGRSYQREPQSGEKIHDLVVTAEEEQLAVQPGDLLDDETRKKIMEAVERMCREMIPGIAEKIIREEIEKLKQETEEEVR